MERNYINFFGRYLNKKDIVLVDTTYTPEYDEYVEYCECNDEFPESPNSADYWDYVAREREFTVENFWSIVNDTILNKEKFIVTGALGLWHGTPTIVPTVFDSFKEAVRKILSRDIEDFKMTLKADGSLDFEAYHHDGTNVLYIHRLSKKGLGGVKSAEERWEDPNPKDYWFKRFYIDEFDEI